MEKAKSTQVPEQNLSNADKARLARIGAALKGMHQALLSDEAPEDFLALLKRLE